MGTKDWPVTSGKGERDPKKEGHRCLLCYLREPGKKSTLVSECVVNTVDAQRRNVSFAPTCNDIKQK